MGKQLTGNEHLVFDGMPIGFLLNDYWAWNASNLLNNTLRGSFCEFIVSAALDVDLSGTNDDWTPYDIEYIKDSDPVRIEVKSCAYLQAWESGKLSSIQFSIRPTKAWSPESGYSQDVKRQSDIYVFCLYTETDRSCADPLILDGWDFYVLPTHVLNEQYPFQKSISLSSLLDLHPIKADFSTLRDAVDASI